MTCKYVASKPKKVFDHFNNQRKIVINLKHYTYYIDKF